MPGRRAGPEFTFTFYPMFKTAKAILVSEHKDKVDQDEYETYWLPLSQIRTSVIDDSGALSVVMPEWLAKVKELIKEG